MLDNIAYYLIIGLFWGLMNEGNVQSKSHRIRLVLFWPVTLVAFLVGFIDAVINSDNDEQDY
jgi:hypothetical protein